MTIRVLIEHKSQRFVDQSIRIYLLSNKQLKPNFKYSDYIWLKKIGVFMLKYKFISKHKNHPLI